MTFEFATAGRIIFGPGAVKGLAPAAASFGKQALYVAGRSGERTQPWIEQLKASGLEVREFSVGGEPTVEVVEAGILEARSSRCDVVIAIGGGSVIDTGKAIATLMGNPGSIYDYLEVVGRGKAFVDPAVPFIAVPTTAGTGSEVTRNAVLGATKERVKVSLRGSQMLPKMAIVDPQLTYSLPPAVTATSGMDALTQLIEPFVSTGANAVTDAVCREGMRRVRRSLKAAYDNGDDTAAREDMSLAALFGGMALANAKLGAVHGFAGPIGGAFPAGHGAVCARLLPIVLEANLEALRERAAGSPTLTRFNELGSILTERPDAGADEAIAWLYRLRDSLGIPALGAFGVRRERASEIISAAKKSNSMQGNPVALTDDELERIFEAAL